MQVEEKRVVSYLTASIALKRVLETVITHVYMIESLVLESHFAMQTCKFPRIVVKSMAFLL